MIVKQFAKLKELRMERTKAEIQCLLSEGLKIIVVFYIEMIK